MKSGKCPKCNGSVGRLHNPVFMLAASNDSGRFEPIVEADGSNRTLFFTPYICDKCNYTELYQELLNND